MSTRQVRFIIFAVFWLLISGVAMGQGHEGHTPGMSHVQGPENKPIETGQSAFAAVAEIVAILEADATTDWSSVSIDTLRAHLVDMDRLTLYSMFDTREPDDQSIEFHITGQGQTLQAIQSMVPTHADMVRDSTGWEIQVSRKPDGITLRVNPGSPDALTKLKALGFFGFMTIGAHHQEHHLQMATGQGH